MEKPRFKNLAQKKLADEVVKRVLHRRQMCRTAAPQAELQKFPNTRPAALVKRRALLPKLSKFGLCGLVLAAIPLNNRQHRLPRSVALNASLIF
jgi:hypothetical protein